MSVPYEQIVERIRAGEDIGSITRSLLGEQERRILQRCAVVRWFDRDLFDTIIRPSMPGDDPSMPGDDIPGFDEVVRARDVRPVPGRRGCYRLVDGVRKDHFLTWWADAAPDQGFTSGVVPADLRQLSAELAEWFEKVGEPLEQLHQLLLASPDRAHALFTDLYTMADRQFDLAACRDLLDVLGDEDRDPLLDRALRQLGRDRAAYLEARSLWAAEYHQSARYLEPSGIREHLEGLLAGGPARVLQLYARGGMGKTMQLRWFIARECVREPRRIPCARVDFDLINPVNASKEPWLVLLAFAGQLNRQLPRAPFDKLLNRYGEYLALLARRASAEGTAAAAKFDRSRRSARVVEDVRDAFVETLAEAAGDRPVVLVLDTLEEVLLRPDGDLAGLVDWLAEVHDHCLPARLLLAGRYDLRERLPSFAERLPAASHRLRELSHGEAEQYLRNIRGITRDDVVDVVVGKTKGMPFMLSLFGDVVEQNPEISAAELREYDPQVLYLVERVLLRIADEQVRWLLRYGVVPRDLGYEFVRDVMRSHLVEGMRGTSATDRPERDRLPRSEEQVPFPTGLSVPHDEAELRALWERLIRYASGYSWVTLSTQDPDTVVFHPDAREPMRRVLRNQRVHWELHKDAVAHFERLAEADPPRWLDWTREAVYHRFQLEGASAGAYWRARLDEAARRGGAEWRFELAEELLRPEYVEDGQPRLWDKHSPIMTSETLVAVHYERAAAAVELAEARAAGPTDPLWSKAEAGMTAAARLEGGHPVAPTAGVARIRAALLRKDGDPLAAATVLEQALAATTDLAERLPLTLAHAEALRAAGSGEAAGSWEVALSIGESLGDTAGVFNSLTGLAEEQTHRDRLDAAAATYERALRTARKIGDGDLEFLTAVRLAEVRLLEGRPGDALDLINSRQPSEWAWEAGRLRGACALALRRPDEALAAYDMAPAWLTDEPHQADPKVLTTRAALRELRATALGELLELPEALADLELAGSLWQNAGSAEGVARCWARAASLQLRTAGSLRQAGLLLRQAQAADPPSDGAAWLDVTLLQAELADRTGNGAEAHHIVNRALAELERQDAPPRQLVRAALEGLAVTSDPAPDRYLRAIVGQLGQVSPASARLVLLDELRRCPALASADAALVAELRRLVGHGLDAVSTMRPDDEALLALRAAQVDRVAGDDRRAVTRLTGAARTLAREGANLVWWDWLRAAGPVLAERVVTIVPELTDNFVREFRDHALLCAAFLVTAAETELRLGGPVRATAALDHAEQLLGEAGDLQSQWQAKVVALRSRLSAWRSDLDSSSYQARYAADLYAHLGDEVSARAVVASEDEARPAPAQTAAREVHLQLGLVGEGTLRVDVVDRDGTLMSSHDLPAGDLLEFESSSLGRDAMYWPLASRLAADWLEAGRLLGWSLQMDRPWSVPVVTDLVDLRIEVVDPPLRPIPWELARVPERGEDTLVALLPPVRHVYRSLSNRDTFRQEVCWAQDALNRLYGSDLPLDGILGPATRAALAAFQRRVGQPADGEPGPQVRDALQRKLVTASTVRPRVLLVTPRSADPYELSVSDQSADLWAIYRDEGFDVHGIVTSPSRRALLKELESELHAWSPDVLHVVASLESATTGIVLSLATELNRPRRGVERVKERVRLDAVDELSVSGFDRLLRSESEHRLAPLLILDVVPPSSTREVIRQLLLRNDFAGELFALGNAPSVLATGLVPEELQYPFYRRLLGSLGEGAYVGDACVLAHRAVGQADGSFRSEVGAAATALFAHNPKVTLPATTRGRPAWT
jgi:predicted negative regulator of RcsB-dependent stress response/peptidoglycan hydrolase-like protein with peptidoglycan-binding domain